MPDYEFKGSYPMVYPAEIGAGFEVTPAEGNPPVGPNGSTVYLSHGDILHSKEPIEHAWLKEIDADTGDRAKTVDELRAELTAAGIEFDPKATKPALRELLAAHGENSEAKNADAITSVVPTETATASPVTPVEDTEPEGAATVPDATAEVSEASDQPTPPALDVQPK